MSNSIFQGVGTALITPFREDALDIPALNKLLDLQLSSGISALVANGTTGEPTTMTHKERVEVLKTVLARAKGKVPVIAGAGSNNTYTAIEYSEEAEALGADALLHVTPYYNKCTQNGLVAHYKAIADRVKIPIILYNVPSRTGLNMLPATVAKLAGYKNIKAIKEASGSVEQMLEIVRLTDGKIDLYSGDDALTHPSIACGGKGVICTSANIMPEYMVKLASAALAGDFKTSLDMQLRALGLIKALFSEVNPIPVKTAASIMGICTDYMRLPLTKMENTDTLKAEMRKLGLIK